MLRIVFVAVIAFHSAAMSVVVLITNDPLVRDGNVSHDVRKRWVRREVPARGNSKDDPSSPFNPLIQFLNPSTLQLSPAAQEESSVTPATVSRYASGV